MLRNRKFAGKPRKNSGVAAEWAGIGSRIFFQNDSRDPYTRHEGCERMRRRNELQSLRVQNLSGGPAGIAQDGISITRGARYEMRTVTRSSSPVLLTVRLTDRSGRTVYAEKALPLVPGDWQTESFLLAPSSSDAEARVSFLFEEKASVTFGALSMLPEGHFRGMRADAVALLKEIGPAILRWPGGNFAGEYRWKDGLLPADMRGPLGAATEDETQPYTHGYDFHEISTDDFIALCREVGAEPFLTINLAWNSPEESAAWVEYVNGSPDTPYGRKRAENGHPEPYRVRFWSLGNEMGYGHMEGPMRPEDYSSLARTHAAAMKGVSPDLELFASGPYPSAEWAEGSAARLLPDVRYISLHHYADTPMDYSSPEASGETFRRIVSASEGARDLARRMRGVLDEYAGDAHISFDEWNFWYAWYRPSSVSEGIFTAKMLHMLLSESGKLDMPVACYFQPVGEGAVLIGDEGARLTANGQVFSLMKAHKGGSLLTLEGAEDSAALATRKGELLTLTLINDEYDRKKRFLFPLAGKIEEAVLLSSEDVLPDSFFTLSPLSFEETEEGISVFLPPHAVARLTVRT